ncbi:S-crystallin 3-like [Octopus bimaculoides]|uniref:S-crystallin 3-like n=1 Tax=Octopus bimaculoides TaxID=37653 RepID=UPI00071DD380|nr:S-crystallin 3-like [Octopus bimaculoides]|eukprot:XP_014771129.1 PREDICTED: S-crystallin 3-like [Octopus bimaculoides]
MSTSSYSLHYFNYRGRAEICRMLFAAANVQYQDIRIDRSEWSRIRNRMPGGMMPMLEFDNKTQYIQSMAITRYLSREFGFHGNTNMEMARVELISDCFNEIMDDYMRMYQDSSGAIVFKKDSDPNVARAKTLRFETTCERILPFMEETLQKYDGGNLFFMGEKMTMADMMCFCALENPMRENPALLNCYPKLQALRNRVMSHHTIAPYLTRRGMTEF